MQWEARGRRDARDQMSRLDSDDDDGVDANGNDEMITRRHGYRIAVPMSQRFRTKV